MKRLLLLSIAVIALSVSGPIPGALAQNTRAKDKNNKVKTEAPAVKEGKRPVIFIPGILGSRLTNSDTGENVWISLRRSKDDDLRLPISPNIAANKDKLVANQVLQRIQIIKYLPQISVYKGVIDFLERSGYKRGDWDYPHVDGAPGERDTYYLFAYDWRRDNVESAAALLQKIDELRKKLRKPDLKFDVVTHSMGGLVARYAAMYGRTDLKDNPVPNWEGAKYFNKIFLAGTPNDGSMEAFDTMLNGYSIGTLIGRRSVGSLDREIAFTAPALFQLLPHGDSLRLYDEDLKPLKLDIYDPAVWKTYKWSAAFDEKFLASLSAAESANVQKYLAAVLARTKKFHTAMASASPPPMSLHFYTYGSDCKTTLDGAVVVKEKDAVDWRTLTRGDSYRNSRGEKINEDQVKKLLYTAGDGTVTRTSLIVESIMRTAPDGTTVAAAEPLFACESHASLLSNNIIQENFLQELLKD